MTTEHIERADEVVDAAAKTGAVTVLEPLKKIEAGIVALKTEAEQVAKLDLSTTAGDKAQRAFRLKCVTLRTDLDEAYETVNRPMLETQRQARKLVADIKAAVLALEEPADRAIKDREAEAERKREARRQAEAARIAGHQQRIAEIRAAATGHAAANSATLAEAIAAVVALSLDGYEEFKPLADLARSETLESLRTLHAGAVEREAETARLAVERAELERQRIEQEATAAAERQRIAAEQAKVQAEQRAEAERLETQRQHQVAEAERQAEEAQRIAQAEQRAREQDAARLAALAATPAPTAAPVAAPAQQLEQLAPITPQESAKRILAARLPDPPPRAEEPATLNLGAICGRLGFTVNAQFLADTLHIQPAKTDKASKLYTERQFGLICTQLVSHVSAMAELYSGETA